MPDRPPEFTDIDLDDEDDHVTIEPAPTMDDPVDVDDADEELDGDEASRTTKTPMRRRAKPTWTSTTDAAGAEASRATYDEDDEERDVRDGINAPRPC